MRSKHLMIAALVMWMVFTVQPVCSTAASPIGTAGPGFLDTEVNCVVEPVFEFSLPPNATVRYPNTQVLVGQFGVRDLLLRDGELLTIELIPGQMAARGTGTALPYNVSFQPPSAVDAANIGQTYDVLVTIDAAAFAATRRPYHDATLLFQVRSSLTDEIIWQGTTTVTARKTPVTGGGNTGGGDTVNGPAATAGNGPTVSPDGGATAQPGETIIDEEVPEVSGPAQDIGDEDIPAAQAGTYFMWWWVLIAAGALLLLLLIFFLLFKRRKKDDDEEENDG